RYPEGDRWVSLSDTFNRLSIGHPTASGARSGDAFDLYRHYNCAGSTEQAETYARSCLAEEDDKRYGAATSDHGRSLAPDGFLTCGGVAHPLTLEALSQRQSLIAQESEQRNEEALRLREHLEEQEKRRWSGDWLRDVPYEVRADALEWAAWHAP